MTAQRLNAVTVLHIHKDGTDAIDFHAAMRESVTANDTRKLLFGVI